MALNTISRNNGWFLFKVNASFVGGLERLAFLDYDLFTKCRFGYGSFVKISNSKNKKSGEFILLPYTDLYGEQVRKTIKSLKFYNNECRVRDLRVSIKESLLFEEGVMLQDDLLNNMKLDLGDYVYLNLIK